MLSFCCPFGFIINAIDKIKGEGRQKMLILLVDNNENEIKKIQEYLAEIFPSADIMPFSDSKRAMEFMCSDRFSIDLCFTKIMMPSVSGFKIAKELKIMTSAMVKLEELDGKALSMEEDMEKAARCFHDEVFAAMSEVREPADKLEELVDKAYWPFPQYEDLLFYV